MKIHFYKYQGTGNDFVIIDDRNTSLDKILNTENIHFICHRRFGIGADGLILLKNSKNHDFKMIYFNSDGNESTMCGNGGRCIVHFAHLLNIFSDKSTFEAIDGLHDAMISEDGLVHLKMINVDNISTINNDTYQLNTGSPHYVSFCDEMPDDIGHSGAAVRYSDIYKKEGINVNFVINKDNHLEVNTYERGVEDETLSCGTGVTAVAIAMGIKENKMGSIVQHIKTKGGYLQVAYELHAGGKASNVWLIGPAVRVFSGVIDI